MAGPSNVDIPQVIAIVRLARGSKLPFVKRVREELGDDGAALFFHLDGEVRLSADAGAEGTPAETAGSRLVLPDVVVSRLGLESGSLVAYIQRAGAVALKAFSVEEQEGSRPEAFDLEHGDRVTRVLRTNPEPGAILARLSDEQRDLALRHDPRTYLGGRDSLEAWQARGLIGIPDPDDESLRATLVEERLSGQDEDGSWDGDVVRTARSVRELCALGLGADHAALARAAGWLLARPQSPHNPGMWFATDDLVARQLEVVADRQAGRGGRFREIRTSEQRRIMGGHDLIRAPCGPRIMWPNGIVLDALLHVGYEGHARVQDALRTLTTQDWCECGYQHGLTSWRRSEPMMGEELDAFEALCVRQFRWGGFGQTDALEQADLAHRAHALRTARQVEDGQERYPLRMPDHIQGCEFITTRALSAVRDPMARRFAEAHLWRFAGIQQSGGAFPDERHGTGFTQAGILALFALYDHPASRIVMARALPWIAGAQNDDGSWGAEDRADAATLAVVTVLLALGSDLPAGMAP